MVTYAWLQTAAPASNEPSPGTIEILRRYGLEDLWKPQTAYCVRVLDALKSPTAAERFAALELSFLRARRESHQGHFASLPLLLKCSQRALNYLGEREPGDPPPGFDQRFAWATMMYDEVVARVVEIVFWKQDPDGEYGDLRLDSGDWKLGDFEELAAVDRLEVIGFRDRFIRYGLGAPLVGLIPRRSRFSESHYFPPKGLSVAVTATLDVEEGIEGRPEFSLRLSNPLKHPSISLGKIHAPLAADFTAPLALLAEKGEKEMQKLGSKEMFHPGKTRSEHRLIMMEPFDPEKIPIVMIHGLWSDPSIWLALTNRIHGDPLLRERYQLWYFMYPSGEPFLWTAAMFRESLGAALDELGIVPGGDEGLVLIAHSMGGLLAKTMVASSGNALWNTIFSQPVGAADFDPETLGNLKRALFFSPDPRVGRVIFMSTPQHGARLARSLIGEIGSVLVKLPKPFAAMLKGIAGSHPELLQPEMRDIFLKGGVDAVGALRPSNPIMKAFAALPIEADLPYYTIIGNQGPEKPEGITDGVVSLKSAHLEGAVSESVVDCTHHSPECVAAQNEVLKILKAALQGAP